MPSIFHCNSPRTLDDELGQLLACKTVDERRKQAPGIPWYCWDPLVCPGIPWDPPGILWYLLVLFELVFIFPR